MNAQSNELDYAMKKTQALRRGEIPALATRRSTAPKDLDLLEETQRRGRPSKFGRAARAVTVTLPEDVIDRLSAINLDISRAIVQLAETRAPRRVLPAPVEVSEYGQGALIVVSPVATLKRLRGVELIPLSDGRALITLDTASALSDLELGLRDALDDGATTPGDREALTGVATVLRRARQAPGAHLRMRTIIVVEPSRRARKTPTARR
jgi:hypothetical protein